MGKRSLVWRLFASHLIVTVIALAAFESLALRLLTAFHERHLASDLETRARLAAEHLQPLFSEQNTDALQQTCRRLGELTKTRFTIILEDGTVVGDSEEDPSLMENHGNRPEVREALQTGEPASAVRFSRTLNQEMLYVAIPVIDDNTFVGVLRAALPVRSISATLSMLRHRVLLSGLAVLILSGMVAWFVSRKITVPLERIRRGAEKFARGNFDEKIPEQPTREMGELADALNQMASQLRDRLREIQRRQKEQEALLSSMVEGVLAVDNDYRILSANRAAAELFGLDAHDSLGRDLREVVRNPGIKRFVSDVKEKCAPLEREVKLEENQNQVLEAHGAILRDSDGNEAGVVVVLHDVTRLRELERVRRDFVANVSHELRTPITSIKGFVETLLDGAMKNPQETERFLQIIAKHADRLNAIIEDLLTLSKVERETETPSLTLENARLKHLLQNAVDLCGSSAEAKRIQIKVNCDEEIVLRVNPSMIEQALVNLLDNAIKYSGESGWVDVHAGLQDSECFIRVADQGCGIPPEHIPRLFERFYRVDKARSRNLGGTGLGLAIVKHIVQAHRGRVEVSSQVGKGSVFTLYLPIKYETTVSPEKLQNDGIA